MIESKSGIAIRLVRDGKPQSLFLHEVDWIAAQELADMHPAVGAAVARWFKGSNAFMWDANAMAFVRCHE